MRFNTYNILATLLCLLTGVSATATSTPSYLRVDRIDVAHRGELLEVAMTVDPAKVRPGRDRQVVFTPAVAGPNDTITMPFFTVAGRNRYFSQIRDGIADRGFALVKAGDHTPVNYTASVPWQDWMDQATVIMLESTQDCCNPVKPLCETPLARLGVMERPFTKSTNARYVALTSDSTVELEAQGSAFIDFIVNRTEIREGYRGNRKELAKIIESVDRVKNDPDATITRLTIKGYASPEGSYDNNVRLAMGRTAALKDYVREHDNFDPEIMMTDYEPEDWEGLERRLGEISIPHKEEILAIVRSDMQPDPKDAEIKRRYPAQYKLILDSIYPALRHSDYTVRYKIRTFVDIEELKRVYRDSPERLRPVDFFRVAETFPQGSPQYEEVLMKCSEIYPRDEEAALNAANILMRRGDYEEASRRLSRAGEGAEAYFSRGMLAAINGDMERAEQFFLTAKELGMPGVDEELSKVRNSGKSTFVQYLIETTEE